MDTSNGNESLIIPYPVRINRYLALTGVSTRRGADDLIVKGLITINGRVAALADRVNEGDKVIVRNEIRRKAFRYLAYNKPRGVLTNPEKGHSAKSIADIVPVSGVFPVGRLDKESEGLIILTDDGRITERLLSPRFRHEKEYEVTIREPIRTDMITALESGVSLEDGPARPAKARKTGPRTLSLTITEGRKHQVRRMLAAVGGTVIALRRVRIMDIRLGSIPRGSYRALRGEELRTFLSALGLSE
ncbi:MAG: rRNA pseudouridine synthase [Candidatus Moranbacteria bacterium]|nr:rRNA pseudouridine synthase [Candidatus Moranbacteria bacterium]